MKKVVWFVLVFTLFGCSGNGEKFDGVFEGRPRVNPPYVVGNYPGTEFIFAIPTSGERPMTWTVEGLPEGLTLNEKTGIIRGIVNEAGDYRVKITAKNARGSQSGELQIRIGKELALTPVMGWNSWNTFGQHLTEALIIETAEAMIANGMRDLGYNYINIDDLWQLKERGADGHIVIDSAKFPRGIKYVADYLHERGFRLGIYSDASKYTCAGVCGSIGYEEVDARDFAEWGVDLLKYDYCGAPASRDTAIVRYRKMGEALRATDRSIIYSICEWGRRQPWEWAREAGGHYWRTTEDIRDAWDLRESGTGLYGIMDIIDVNGELADYAGPGFWNDPDMLVVGIFGNSSSINSGKVQYGCTLKEYRTHMSMWCMMAAPLLSGNDVRNMPDSVLNILTNPEIIAINQDQLGIQGKMVKKEGDCEIWIKPLYKGEVALAVMNRGEQAEKVEVPLQLAGFVNKALVRDVWLHRDLGEYESLKLDLEPHVTVVLRLTQH